MTRIFARTLAIALLAGWAAFDAARASATQFAPVLADTSYRDTDPAPSPDGQWVAFQSNRTGTSQIWLLPMSGGKPHVLTQEPDSSTMHAPVRVMTPTWLSDGKTVIYVSTREGFYNLYAIPVEGGEARPLSKAPGSQRFASCSMDGKEIVFASGRLAPTQLFGFQLFIMGSQGEIDGPPARQITFGMGSPGHPVWSPDGKWIAYVAKDVDTTRTVKLGPGVTTKESPMFARFRIYKMPAAGGKAIQLTGKTPEKKPSEDTWPSWSPDGKWIAFGRNVGGESNLWVLEVATGKMFPITTSNHAMKPTWTYDGKAIYYATLGHRDEDIWVATDLTLKPPAAASKPASTTTKKKPATSTNH